MLRRVTLVRTDVSEERSASIIWVTRIGELGSMSPITINWRMLQRNTKAHIVLSKHRFLQEPHRVTSQKTAFFIVTTVKSTSLTENYIGYPVNWTVQIINVSKFCCASAYKIYDLYLFRKSFGATLVKRVRKAGSDFMNKVPRVSI
jgi:hypothetical protein